jgi:hypothetical protein
VLIDTLRGVQKSFRSNSRFTCLTWAQNNKNHPLQFLTGNASGAIQLWDTCSDLPLENSLLKGVSSASSSSPLLGVSADSRLIVDSNGRVSCFINNDKLATILDDGVLGPCCLAGSNDHMFVSKMDRVYAFHRSSLQYTWRSPDGCTIVSILSLGGEQGVIVVTESGAIFQLERDTAEYKCIGAENIASGLSSAIASGSASEDESDESDTEDEGPAPGSGTALNAPLYVETVAAQLIGGTEAVTLLQIARHDANVEKSWIRFLVLPSGMDKQLAPMYSFLSVCCSEFQTAILGNNPAIKMHPEWKHFASAILFSANCAMCNVAVPSAASQSACPNGHPFSVCSKSKKVITSLNMFKCRICKRSVAINEQAEGSCCFWCRGPLRRADL